MWIILAFLSALCLGGYDISKKIALRDNRVLDVLTLSICLSAVLLSLPLVLSRLWPEMMEGTLFFVPRLDAAAHGLTVLKSALVLSSWVFAYISLKHLPLSVVSPMQATRPMWTLIGALLLFGERLNGWQWAGVVLALGSILLFSLAKTFSTRPSSLHPFTPSSLHPLTPYYISLALAILLGACAGLYDKFLMRRYDHNAVQVYYTMYQAVMMLAVWLFSHRKSQTSNIIHHTSNISAIALISLFLIISDNVYMLALRDPDSLIAVVSTVRRGGAVIGFAYGLIVLKEGDLVPKLLCMSGILAGLIFLALGTL